MPRSSHSSLTQLLPPAQVSLFMIAWLFATPLCAAEDAEDRAATTERRSVEVAARDFRIVIYNSLRTNREAYDRFREVGDEVQAKWALVDGREAYAESVVAWFDAQREAVQQGSLTEPSEPAWAWMEGVELETRPAVVAEVTSDTTLEEPTTSRRPDLPPAALGVQSTSSSRLVSPSEPLAGAGEASPTESPAAVADKPAAGQRSASWWQAVGGAVFRGLQEKSDAEIQAGK